MQKPKAVKRCALNNECFKMLIYERLLAYIRLWTLMKSIHLTTRAA